MRLLTYFTLGAMLVVLWFVLETTGLWSPTATRTEQRPVGLMAPADEIAAGRNEQASPSDDPVSLAPTGQPAFDTPPEAVQPDSRPPSSSVGASAGGEALRVDADASAAAAETGDRTGWSPPPDEPPLGQVLRSTEAPAADYFEGLQPPDVRSPERSAESRDDGSEQLDVDALLGTYLEVLRLLVREGR